MINLIHDWIHYFMPHILRKINRGETFSIAAGESLSTVAARSESKAMMACPTTTVSSASASNVVTVPANGERISIETLSVSITSFNAKRVGSFSP